jgi:hypothetical protein
MKKDIEFLVVKDVHIAIVKSGETEIEWNVFLINRNNETLTNVFVSSYGYGGEGHEDKKTSTIRHFLGDVPASSFKKIEGIDPALFYLNNEYLLSYFIDNQLFDKKFIFVPDSITIQNCIKIEPYDFEGVLHA